MTSETEEGREKALNIYKVLALAFGVLGVGMLACGIIAAMNQDEDQFGPPYFIGGFTVGVTASFGALCCTCIIMKAAATTGASSDNALKKQELGCAIQGQYMLSIFMFMGGFIGVMMAGLSFSGIDEERSELNKTLAIVILVGCILSILLTVISMCTVCTYGKYFGVVMQRGRRGRAVLVNINNTTAPMGGTSSSVFATDPRTSELERQNQLLQQQLALQQQLNQQQQQQQTQYGFATAPPAYPPSNAMYPPPPPSYNDIK